MSRSDIERLKTQVEGSSSLDRELLAQADEVLRRTFSGVPASSDAISGQVEHILHVVDSVLPTWTIQLTGKAMEPNGHWRCSLRRSRGNDEDELIGLGSGAVVGLALVAALLHVAMQKTPH